MIAANRRFERNGTSVSESLAQQPGGRIQARKAGPGDSSPGGEAWKTGGPKPLSNPRHRLWQIDAVRGMAGVCMVFYHFMWDMMFFGLYPHDVTSGGWRLFARSVAITFLVLVGVSMVLTAQRKRPAERNRQWLERGAKVFGWGLLISVVTRIFLGE